MPYEEFRERIDRMRNILVGAVPSPAGQIDQITYALIYKFLNDIDGRAASIPGGKRSYFIGDYEKFNWHNLMSPNVEAQDRLVLYRDAIQTMAKNKNLPELFREIYQNAFLPFNSAQVLNLFLKEIDHFTHGDSDDIGDAYEYLLSITGAQGDVGQFRTPRHIIEFIVAAVNPTKDDRVLDPAVGTAGFLIAAYKHVKSQHDGKDSEGNPNDEKQLTSDEREKLYKNYRGFDIDPTMVRTASVNMYLHGFRTPDIINHDALSSEDYWNDRYDVILANPPFMTPKGGIQPHKKFGISANRAEVLFVDYIASHLKPNGRAGIVVPEGIIFHSGKAYKELRKNLVENSLYAVVSLPAGVFNPYAGVKTSVLLLDKELAKQRDEVLFVKVENDGFSLNAQRRKIIGDQLPEALQAIERFKNGEELQTEFAHAVSRGLIAESGDYNLSGDRYKIVDIKASHDYPVVELEEIAEVRKGSAITKAQINPDGPIPVVAGGQKPAYYHDVSNRDPDVITISASGAYAGFVNYWTTPIFASDCSTVQAKDSDKALNRYLYETLKYLQDDIYKLQTGGGQPHVYPKDIAKIKIPLPPIEIQREIVAELDGYQKIIDAAQTIVQTYKPTIKINPEWNVVELGEVIKLNFGERITKKESQGTKYPVYGGGGESFRTDEFNRDSEYVIARFAMSENCVRYVDGKFWMLDSGGTFSIKPDYIDKVDKDYVGKILLNQQDEVYACARGGAQKNLNNEHFYQIKIPLPPIEIQREIVAELEAEQQLINANKKLIEIYQQKIKSKIAEVWGE